MFMSDSALELALFFYSYKMVCKMTEETPQVHKKSGFFKELVKFTLIAFLIVVPFRIFIAQPFIVNGASMEPTFHPGEYLIVDQLTYKAFSQPKRGEVIIFRYPQDTTKFFIKRVVGLPGETIEIRGENIRISNSDFPEGFLLDEDYLSFRKQDNLKTKLKSDEYFVMGDNRPQSSDSRIWGPLKEELIIGRPLVRLFPVNRLQFLPGSFSFQR
ncbi:MAG: signal peptidase I [Candidatus Paceibacterota bacterium]|nr:MAG: signal peptidase I [Candidatus Paceibacterota bacterium]